MAEHPLHRQTILGAMGALIVGHLVVRGWAIYPSWFYTDDYRLLHDASSSAFGLEYLTWPFDSQFMPMGRGIAWVVAQAGPADWNLAASFILTWQLAAAITCAWMLLTLFGARVLVVLLLGVYLTSASIVPAFMWWAASLNQLPLHVVLFASVATWVHYLRSRRPRWLVATTALLLLGLLCYVKTILVLPVLAYLLLAYFSYGSLQDRVRRALRQWWRAVLALGVLAVSYSTYYLTQVPQVFAEGRKPVGGDLADAMLGTAFPVGLLGGPWRWDASNPPNGYADPPSWTVHAAWALIALGLVACALLRHRSGRAWGLLAAYVAVDFALLLESRAQVLGGEIGLEYRYLTDATAVAVLAAGLALMPLEGALEPSESRSDPLLALRLRRGHGLALAVAICAGGLVSSITYARIWHTDNPGKRFAENVQASLRGQDRVDLADQVVPPEVIPGYSSPYNTTSRLVPLLVPSAHFPSSTSRLVVLDENGRAAQALIKDPVRSTPGPLEDCGWLVVEKSQTIPLTAPTVDYRWWVRVGYLSSANTTLRFEAGDTVEDVPIKRGLHSVYLQVTGVVDELRVIPTGSSATCIDGVEVGLPTVGPPL